MEKCENSVKPSMSLREKILSQISKFKFLMETKKNYVKKYMSEGMQSIYDFLTNYQLNRVVLRRKCLKTRIFLRCLINCSNNC